MNSFKEQVRLLQNQATAKDWRRLLTLRYPTPRWLYTAYLGSLTWKEKRAKRLEFDDHKCQGCTLMGFLDVHHKTYKNIGDENVAEDLVSLCRNCHKATHAGETLLLDEIAAIIRDDSVAVQIPPTVPDYATLK